MQTLFFLNELKQTQQRIDKRVGDFQNDVVNLRAHKVAAGTLLVLAGDEFNKLFESYEPAFVLGISEMSVCVHKVSQYA